MKKDAAAAAKPSQTAEPSVPVTEGTLPSPVLVTGATGFVGGHLVRALVARGVEVRATGRNLRNGLDLDRMGAEFRPVDLTDREAMIEVCRGVRSVVHAGALSSAWGGYEDFRAANVGGTENVIEGCRKHGIARLVALSSPSVMTRGRPQLGLTEADPLPERFVSVYSETKKLGEDLVRAAQVRGLETVILRPKAIYGPGDNAIFPRVFRALAGGRLPVIGDGSTVTNLTHVEDVVQAILLALVVADAVGRTYLITGGEDVRIWDVILDVGARLGLPAPRRRLSVPRAMRIAWALEQAWKLGALPGEPPLTRHAVGILGFSQTYDISTARRELGYAPRVSVREGIDRLIPELETVVRFGGRTVSIPRSATPGPAMPRRTERRGSRDPVRPELTCTILRAGGCRVREALFRPGGRQETVDIPALFALIEHPYEGTILFDTGYSPRFLEATRRFPYNLYARMTPVEIGEKETAVARLRERGIDPRTVRWIILSHFDPDHTGGLRDFPEARIVCSRRAWEAVAGKTGLSALRARLLPGHLPNDLAARLKLLPDPDGAPIDPFPASIDLFGDGSIRIVDLPGHAPGQIGAFVRSEEGWEYFLAGDGCWTLAAIERTPPRGGIHRWLAHDKRSQDRTYELLRRLCISRPELIVVPSHCPEAAARAREIWAEGHAKK